MESYPLLAANKNAKFMFTMVVFFLSMVSEVTARKNSKQTLK